MKQITNIPFLILKHPTVYFYTRKKAVKKTGSAPVLCVITSNGKKLEFSIGFDVPAGSLVNGKINALTPLLKQKQVYLEKAREKLERIIMRFSLNDQRADPIVIKNTYVFGVGGGLTLLATIQEFIERQSLLIGTDICFETFLKYKQCSNHINFFVTKKLKRSDLSFNEVKEDLANKFYLYLRGEKKFELSYIKKIIHFLKRTIDYAVINDYADKNYLKGYTIKNEIKKEIKHLSVDELIMLDRLELANKEHEHVRDCFLFQCFTGLAYIDLKHFTIDNISTDSKGKQWLIYHRGKTKSKCAVPLLSEAETLIFKYQITPQTVNSKGLFPCYTNQAMNRILKKLAECTGIEQSILSSHTARKTFAMTALNKKGVSIETVSKMLGHSKIAMTQQYYGYINTTKIANEMENVSFIN